MGIKEKSTGKKLPEDLAGFYRKNKKSCLLQQLFY